MKSELWASGIVSRMGFWEGGGLAYQRSPARAAVPRSPAFFNSPDRFLMGRRIDWLLDGFIQTLRRQLQKGRSVLHKIPDNIGRDQLLATGKRQLG